MLGLLVVAAGQNSTMGLPVFREHAVAAAPVRRARAQVVVGQIPDRF